MGRRARMAHVREESEDLGDAESLEESMDELPELNSDEEDKLPEGEDVSVIGDEDEDGLSDDEKTLDRL